MLGDAVEETFVSRGVRVEVVVDEDIMGVSKECVLRVLLDGQTQMMLWCFINELSMGGRLGNVGGLKGRREGPDEGLGLAGQASLRKQSV